MDEIRCALEFREDETRTGPGRLIGRLLQYGERITHSKGPEVFESRALQWGDSGVVLYDSHDQTPRRPVAIVHPEQSDSEARIDIRLPDTSAGRRVAAGVREGSLRGLSVEFRSAAERYRDGVRRISKAWLSGLALVENPAYSSATVEVREKDRSRREIYRWL